MIRVLNQTNFSIDNLRELYQIIVVPLLNHSHNANAIGGEIIDFFNNTIKSLYNPIISAYPGGSLLLKSLAVLEEFRGEILNRILVALDDICDPNQVTLINKEINIKVKDLIRQYKNELEVAELGCPFYNEFKVLLSKFLQTNNVKNINNNLLIGWMSLDPANNLLQQQSIHSSHEPELVEVIAIYYLATKFNYNGLILSETEQDRRFEILINNLALLFTSCNQYENYNIEYTNLVIKSGFESHMMFLSKQEFVNKVVGDVVAKKVREWLLTFNLPEKINHMLTSLTPVFADQDKLHAILLSNSLKEHRYSLFDVYNNDAVFFKLIKEQIKAEFDDNIHNLVIKQIYSEISTYSYQSFIKEFVKTEDLQGLIENSQTETISKELSLIGYAFSDPAYSCYTTITDLCTSKLKQLQEGSFSSTNLEQATYIANKVIDEMMAIISPQPLFVAGFNKLDLIVIIKSYKRGIYHLETDLEFINRILQKNYVDLNELGQKETINGLREIVNQALTDRAILLEQIANLILQEHLANFKLGVNDSSDSKNITTNFPRGYVAEQENYLGIIAKQKLQKIHTIPEPIESIYKVRFVSTGIRNTMYYGPYSSIVDLPNVPTIQPYYPNGISINQDYNNGIPSFPIVVSLSTGTLSNLPAGVKEQLINYDININDLDVYFCVQNLPWTLTEKLLLRPHAWLYNDSSFKGDYCKKDEILAGVMAINGDLNLTKLTAFTITAKTGVNQEVLFLPNNMKIMGINDFNHSHSLYSFCIVNNRKKAALALHWLLNKEDYLKLTDFINTLNSHNQDLRLADLINWCHGMKDSRLNNNDNSAVQALEFLLFGGKKSSYTNNSQYHFMDQEIQDQDPSCWRREILNFFCNKRANRTTRLIEPEPINTNATRQANPNLDELPLLDRIKEANFRLR